MSIPSRYTVVSALLYSSRKPPYWYPWKLKAHSLITKDLRWLAGTSIRADPGTSIRSDFLAAKPRASSPAGSPTRSWSVSHRLAVMMYSPAVRSGIVSDPLAEVVNSRGAVLESLAVTVTLKAGIPSCHPNVVAVEASSEFGTNVMVNSPTEARGGVTNSVPPRQASTPSAAKQRALFQAKNDDDRADIT